MKNFNKILFRGTIAVSIANAGSQIVGLLLLPLFTEYLSPKEFGIISMVSMIVTFLALLYNPGIMSGTMRLFHATESENERKFLVGSANKFFVFIPILPLVVGLIWGEAIFSFIFKDFDFYPYGFLSLLLAFLIQPSRMWSTLMTLLYKIEKTAFLTALSVVLGLITAVVLIVVFDLGAMGRVLAMFVPAIFLYIISFISIKRYTKGVWSFESMKKQLIFGLPLIVGLWAYQGLSFFGKYFLEQMSSLEDVGIYTVGTTLASVPMLLVLGFKQLWAPIFYENMNSKSYKTITKLIKSFTVVISILSLSLILFIKEIVLLLIDSNYYSVIKIIPILVLASFFNGLLTISNSFLSFNNNFFRISLFGLIASLLNILLNLVLIPIYGVIGASIALVISYFIFYILGVISERKKISLVQNKKSAYIPPLLLVVGVLGNLLINENIFLNNFSFYEFFTKIFYLIFTIIVFFKFKLIEKKDFISIINLISRKK